MEGMNITPVAISSIGQGTLEAIIKSQQIWTAGVQDISQTVAAMAQARLDRTLSTFKALSTAKSLQEAIDLQASHARMLLETAVAETGRLTTASIKLAEQSIAPITEQITLAVEAMKPPAG